MSVSFQKALGRLQALVGRPELLVSLLFLACFGCLLAVLAAGELPYTDEPSEGAVSPRDYTAPRTIEIVDEKATDESRRRAAAEVAPVYTFEPRMVTQAEDRVRVTFDLLARRAALRAQAPPDLAERLAELDRQMPLPLSQKTVQHLSAAPPPLLDYLENATRHVLVQVLKEGVREDQVPEARQAVGREVRQLPGLDPSYQEAVIEIASGALVPSKFLDPEATSRARQAAMEGVTPIKRLILQGQAIVRKGEIVTPETLEDLKALGLLRRRLTAQNLLAYSLLVLVLMLMVMVYLRQERPDIYRRPASLMLLALVVIAVAGVGRYLTTISPYLAPVATASMLIAFLLEARLALLTTALLAILTGIFTQAFPPAAVALLTGTVGVLAVARVSGRFDLIAASLVVWASNVLAVLVFSLMSTDEWGEIAKNTLFFGGLNGLTSALVAVGALPFLENFFGITTHIKLVELSSPSEPLLQRLLKEAPGTWQHSVMVANMAESAAQAVGADSLLARVGAYYHDVGKIKRPRFFIENQTGPDNPHDRIAPSLSAMIIMAHVRDGLELAAQYKLPDTIVDFIRQHHGTSLVAYFYHAARTRSQEPVFEEDFRYPGPKPRTRESAIVMICDGIEAASRTLPSPTPERLAELVNKMIDGLVEDGQLDECDLSLKDLSVVRETLIRNLTGLYHQRVEYPDVSTLSSGKVTALRPRTGTGGV
ncbi:MAG TPA: HDIG domain-containing protein [Candidatus Nitrosotenuis sp.]|nr:HDIG domain-containing protein [Candidatus Nitrosotenuis sp.]